MKLIIAGSRTFCKMPTEIKPRNPEGWAKYHADYEILKDKMREWTWDHLEIPSNPLEVVSGRAPGTDEAGERWASECSLTLHPFPADWATHGKKAGILRNLKMAQAADQAIVFIRGDSKGSTHMIGCMKKLGKPVTVVSV